MCTTSTRVCACFLSSACAWPPREAHVLYYVACLSYMSEPNCTYTWAHADIRSPKQHPLTWRRLQGLDCMLTCCTQYAQDPQESCLCTKAPCRRACKLPRLPGKFPACQGQIRAYGQPTNSLTSSASTRQQRHQCCPTVQRYNVRSQPQVARWIWLAPTAPPSPSAPARERVQHVHDRSTQPLRVHLVLLQVVDEYHIGAALRPGEPKVQPHLLQGRAGILGTQLHADRRAES